MSLRLFSASLELTRCRLRSRKGLVVTLLDHINALPPGEKMLNSYAFAALHPLFDTTLTISERSSRRCSLASANLASSDDSKYST